MNIYFYDREGVLESSGDLKEVAGMLSRVILKDGSSIEGYADPLRLKGNNEYDGLVHDYIYLWTFKNLNEDTQQYDGFNIEKVNISDVDDIHCILYSNPRWGGPLTNKFWIK